MTKKTNPKTLPDEDLITYFLYLNNDSEQTSIIKSIICTAVNTDNLKKILRRIVDKNLKLAVCYPSVGSESPEGAEILAEIEDGHVYIVK